MTMLVNIDGELVEPALAKVSVLDRGFLYGDSVYEVCRTYAGRPFCLDEHLRRLEHSARRLGIELPESGWLRQQINRTIEAGGNPESYCRVVVTRGSGPINLDPATAGKTLTVIIVKELESPPPRVFTEGIRICIPTIRRNPPVSLDPAIKSGNYLNSILALAEARRAGFDDALMLDIQGRLAEASTANVFVYLEGRLCTPTLETGILEGITRSLILRLAPADGIAVAECDLYPNDLERATEVMLTGTVREVAPVVQVDRRRIGSGRPGPVAGRLLELLRRHALAQTER